MKKLTKFFLLALCTLFLFLGFSFAQNQENSYEDEDNLYTDDDININSEFNSGNQYQRGSQRATPEGESNIVNIGVERCTCGMNIFDFLVGRFLYWIEILLGIMLIITSLKIISYKRLSNTYGNNRLFYLPIINLYSLSKMTIGKIRFFILILLLGFFVYNVYAYITFDNYCCFNPIRQGYSGIIVGICSIVILGVLLSKLSYLTKHSQKDSDKKSPNG